MPEPLYKAPLVSFMAAKAVDGVTEGAVDRSDQKLILVSFMGTDKDENMVGRDILLNHDDSHRLAMAMLESLRDHGCETAQLMLEMLNDCFEDDDSEEGEGTPLEDFDPDAPFEEGDGSIDEGDDE